MSAIGWLVVIIGIGIIILAFQGKSIGGTFSSLFSTKPAK